MKMVWLGVWAAQRRVFGQARPEGLGERCFSGEGVPLARAVLYLRLLEVSEEMRMN